MTNTSDNVKVGLMLAFVLVLIALGPLLVIWAWNVLFGTLHSIPYTIETWAAIVIMGSLFRTKITTKRQD